MAACYVVNNIIHVLFALYLLQTLHSNVVVSLPEQGIQQMTFRHEGASLIGAVTKSMYNKSHIVLEFQCNVEQTVSVKWYLGTFRCAQYAIQYTEEFDTNFDINKSELYDYSFSSEKNDDFDCKAGEIGYIKNIGVIPMMPTDNKSKPDTDVKEKNATEVRRRRGDGNSGDSSNKTESDKSTETVAMTSTVLTAEPTALPKPTTPTSSSMAPVTPEPPNKMDPNGTIGRVPRDGFYVLIVRITITDPGSSGKNKVVSSRTSSVTVMVRTQGSLGYLSAVDWPLLPFYAVMFCIYAFYMILWLVFCCCYRRDLLRVQYWIFGVILLGLLEKAILLGEYDTLNRTGSSVRGAVIFGELMSCAKRTLARMLVIIVSIGFGVVKPRLGPTLYKVLAVGAVYYVFSAVEGCIRVLGHKADVKSLVQIIPVIVLAVVDSFICWWIFTGLVNTMRTLRIRRNLIKLSLYRHFTNTLIFSVIGSVVFMVWSILMHKSVACLTDWKELWVDDAFWHLLFSVLLLVIMVLWRPSANNQRYAYSPLLDREEDEMEEPMLNDAFEGMKLRSTGKSNGSSTRADQADEDLKWIEDNIPATIADSTLPSLLDSEEEIMTTKYEMSKMQ